MAGILIDLESGKISSTDLKATASALDFHPHAFSEPFPDPLYFHQIAMIDMAAIIAAHPHAPLYTQLLQDTYPPLPANADNHAKYLRNAEIKDMESRSRGQLAKDIRGLVAEYAATNGLKLILDQSVSISNPATFPYYSSNLLAFQGITNLPGVRLITSDILQKLRRFDLPQCDCPTSSISGY